MNVADYRNFEDFILDDSFREFTEGTRDESVKFWNDWILDHPEMEGEIRQAREVLLTLLGNRKRELASEKAAALKRLLADLDYQPRLKSRTRVLTSVWSGIAATILLSIGLGWIWYTIYNKGINNKPERALNEIIVPVGEKSQIILSDGTHVWINSGSRFTYPLNFGKERREVSLEGEAYFDVTRGTKTFTVSTHDARIQVLGTAFNVKSYPEDDKTQTTVVRGLVRVQSKARGIRPVLIGPEQMAVLKDTPVAGSRKIENRDLTILNQVNTSVITSWKDQLLIFADETFADIAIKMERWFNMKIRIEDEDLKKQRYTGKFVNNETVYQVLEAIEVTTPIRYYVNKDEIVITKK